MQPQASAARLSSVLLAMLARPPSATAMGSCGRDEDGSRSCPSEEWSTSKWPLCRPRGECTWTAINPSHVSPRCVWRLLSRPIPPGAPSALAQARHAAANPQPTASYPLCRTDLRRFGSGSCRGSRSRLDKCGAFSHTLRYDNRRRGSHEVPTRRLDAMLLAVGLRLQRLCLLRGLRGGRVGGGQAGGWASEAG